MKQVLIRLSSVLVLSVFVLSLVVLHRTGTDKETVVLSKPYKNKTLEDRARTNEGRAEFFFNLMRDPATNSIPAGIRAGELAHAETLPSESRFKGAQAVQYLYDEVGPNDVGGRTRALAIDLDNSNVIIAGGVSGGIWKSTDGGNSWTLKTVPGQSPSVTYLVQDPRPGNRNVWYYSTGEFSGNSAGARGGGASFFGNGIYKSTDSGETWSLLSSTASGNAISFDSPFDFVSRVVVSPTTGSVFTASSGFGVYRSSDGENFGLVLGGPGQHAWADVAVAPNGNLIAVISQSTAGVSTQDFSPGVYLSTTDGATWQNITPAFFPATHQRSVIAIAPSNPNFVYVFTQQSSTPKLSFINLSNPAQSQDRSSEIANFGSPVGDMNLQGGYNMTAIVHPTNPDLVMIGGTNIFRSFNGFADTPAQPNKDSVWVGGYAKANNVSGYPSHHPDNHVLFFDPANSNRLWSGHDGGVSVTENILSTDVVWASKNNGYNVTQFYTVALPPSPEDDRILGGTQDNGTPFFRFNLTGSSTSSTDVSSGDGSYAHMGSTQAFVSSQRGSILRIKYNMSGDVPSPFLGGAQWSRVTPAGATGQLFIHPYKVDPNFQNSMFYPGTTFLWRNLSIGSIPDFNQNPTSTGWEQMTNINLGPVTGYTISTLEITDENPKTRVYYGASSTNQTPLLFRWDRADFFSDGEVNISIPGAPSGAYVHDIAVNPENGDEVIAIFSNYNIPSIFHSSDAGLTWTDVEGNLANSPSGPGPSVRTAAIVTYQGTKMYFVGTSTGLYSTPLLAGAATVWTRESPDQIGVNVVEFLDYRPIDGTLAVATHGRGMFIGKPNQLVSNEDELLTEAPSRFELSQNFPNPFNPSTNIQFTLPGASIVSLSIFDVNGRKVMDVLNGVSRSSGTFNEIVDASGLASGIYIYRLNATPVNGGNGFTQTKKMTLIK